MRWFRDLASVMGLLVGGGRAEVTGGIPRFPQQFSARLEIISHLVDRTKDYPPWIREMDIAYDYVSGQAKVVVNSGLNAGKTFLRLYGSKKEYVIRQGDYPSCRRSYLGEAMPLPELPGSASFQGMQMVEGLLCEHWLQDDGTSRVHVFIDSAEQGARARNIRGSSSFVSVGNLVDEELTEPMNSLDAHQSLVPRRLTEETVAVGAAAAPLVTYDFRDIKVGPQAPELFALPEEYLPREACDLHVGGSPYVHLFHHYLRV